MLGLLIETRAAWLPAAVADLDRLLADHAHCEMKAASNALSLSTRCIDHPRVVRSLVEVSAEEIEHFKQVLDLLEQREVRLGIPEEDTYVAKLRAGAAASRRSARPISTIVDRLLVGALIEARSCERFKLLAKALTEKNDPLGSFYETLLASEARHHRLFVHLAIEVSGDEDIAPRFLELREIEAQIVSELPGAPTIHG